MSGWLRSSMKQLVPSFVVRRKLGLRSAILFTFDDGPHPEFTRKVLDLLDDYAARSVFFIPGTRIARAPDLLREIVRRGHALGNHGYSHKSADALSYRQLLADIQKCQQLIFEHSGTWTTLYRPPRGVVTPALIAAAWRSGHCIVHWSLDSGEYSTYKGAAADPIAASFMQKVHERAIVLSHDDLHTTPEYLKLVLPQLKERGFDLSVGLTSLG